MRTKMMPRILRAAGIADSITVQSRQFSFATPALRPIVIRFGRVGDMVMLSPLLNLLRRRYGMPCWLFGAGSWSAQLYRGHADIAHVWSLGGRHTPLLLSPTWWR